MSGAVDEMRFQKIEKAVKAMQDKIQFFNMRMGELEKAQNVFNQILANQVVLLNIIQRKLEVTDVEIQTEQFRLQAINDASRKGVKRG
jgi:hypothetical protein